MEMSEKQKIVWTRGTDTVSSGTSDEKATQSKAERETNEIIDKEETKPKQESEAYYSWGRPR